MGLLETGSNRDASYYLSIVEEGIPSLLGVGPGGGSLSGQRRRSLVVKPVLPTKIQGEEIPEPCKDNF